MQRLIAVALVLVPVLGAGCSEPENDGFPPWTPSNLPGGPQAMANGTFQFVEVSGTVREVGVEQDPVDCDMAPPNADVDVERRKLILDQGTMDKWNHAATIIVRDTVHMHAEGSSCNVPGLLWPQPELQFWGETSTTGLSMHILALDGGPAIGAAFRVLGEGVPYHHRVHWDEVDPSSGEVREFVLDLTFLYRGVWSWADAEVGYGQTHWAS